MRSASTGPVVPLRSGGAAKRLGSGRPRVHEGHTNPAEHALARDPGAEAANCSVIAIDDEHSVLTAPLALGMTGLVGASAASANPSPETSQADSWDPLIAITRDDSVVAKFTMPEATADDPALLEQATAASAPAKPGTITPQAQVTVGVWPATRPPAFAQIPVNVSGAFTRGPS